MRIGVVGCGNLGSAIIKGLVKSYDPGSLMASKRNLTENQSEIFGVRLTDSNAELIEQSDIVIIALKPFNVIPFLVEHKLLLNNKKHTVVSAATGITIAEMKEILPELDFFRVMPNTAAGVQESITAVSFTSDQLNRVEDVRAIFNTVGDTLIINEELMESATVLGACGIAYVLRFIRAMIQGGIEVGFDAKTASIIVAQTVKGAAELLIQNQTHPEEEIDKVTTPKGCTIVGLNEMEHSGFSSALIKGITSSYHKIEKH